MCNMGNKLYINRNPLDLVKGLDVGETVWKGMDGAAESYCYSKSAFGQTKLSSELSVAIDVQVEAPGAWKMVA